MKATLLMIAVVAVVAVVGCGESKEEKAAKAKAAAVAKAAAEAKAIAEAKAAAIAEAAAIAKAAAKAKAAAEVEAATIVEAAEAADEAEAERTRRTKPGWALRRAWSFNPEANLFVQAGEKPNASNTLFENKPFSFADAANAEKRQMGRPSVYITHALGKPSGTQASGRLYIWFYDNVKVDWQGTNYTKINVIVSQGRVLKVTIDPRSRENLPLGVQPLKSGGDVIKEIK